MAHLLFKFGAAALKPSQSSTGKLLPPLISHAQAMKLREKMYMEGQTWPFEHLVPGLPQPPPGADLYLQRQEAKEQKKEQRAKEIREAMAKMPQLIAQHKASLRLDWDEVSELDKLTLTRTAIKRKYIKRRLSKQTS